MPLGTEVGLGAGNIELDGDPANPTVAPPHFLVHVCFGPCLLWPNGLPP